MRTALTLVVLLLAPPAVFLTAAFLSSGTSYYWPVLIGLVALGWGAIWVSGWATEKRLAAGVIYTLLALSPLPQFLQLFAECGSGNCL